MDKIIEPIAYKDYRSAGENKNRKNVNRIVEALNGRVKVGETEIRAWNDQQEPHGDILTVDELFKAAGWGGVRQYKEAGRSYYSIKLVMPASEDKMDR